MKRLIVLTVIILVLGAASPAMASAVLIDFQGKVKVSLPGKKSVPATVGLELPDGSVVAVGKKAKASVMLENGAIDQIPAGKKYKVGAKTAGAKRTDLGSGMALAMRELAASGQGPTVHGMVREKKGPKARLSTLTLGQNMVNARYPSGTAIRLGSRITFEWEDRPPIDWHRPALVIDDESKRHIAIRSLKKGYVKRTVSAKKVGLAKGRRYSWYLASRKGKLKGKTRRFRFHTLSAREERRINAKKGRIRALDMSQEGRQLLLAQLSFQYGLYNDVVEVLGPLWQKYEAPFLRKLLYLCYARMGRGREARKYSPPQP